MWRNEYKYAVSAAEVTELRARAVALMPLDPHASAAGGYTIRSVYFDTPANACLLDNINGTDPRRKWRIRTYDAQLSHIAIECKAKQKGRCHKRSTVLTLAEAQALLCGQAPAAGDALLQEFVGEMLATQLRPVVVVEYDRIPYVWPVGNVRFTLDLNLRATADAQSFLEPDLPLRPVMPLGMHIAEVKWDDILPPHLATALNLPNLRWQSMSKFQVCRQHTMPLR